MFIVHEYEFLFFLEFISMQSNSKKVYVIGYVFSYGVQNCLGTSDEYISFNGRERIIQVSKDIFILVQAFGEDIYAVAHSIFKKEDFEDIVTLESNYFYNVVVEMIPCLKKCDMVFLMKDKDMMKTWIMDSLVKPYNKQIKYFLNNK